MTDEAELAAFRERARAWLDANVAARASAEGGWGAGPDSVAVFHDLELSAERALIADLTAWQRRKFEAGFGALAWPAEFGGASLDPEFDEAFAAEETRYATPPRHELVSVTLHLIAPTIRLLGSPDLQQLVIGPLLR